MDNTIKKPKEIVEALRRILLTRLFSLCTISSRMEDQDGDDATTIGIEMANVYQMEFDLGCILGCDFAVGYVSNKTLRKWLGENNPGDLSLKTINNFGHSIGKGKYKDILNNRSDDESKIN